MIASGCPRSAALVAITRIPKGDAGAPSRRPSAAVRRRDRRGRMGAARCGESLTEARAFTAASPPPCVPKQARASAPVEAPPLPACVGAGESAQIPPLPSSLNQGKKSRAKGAPASPRQDCPHPGADPAGPPHAARTAAAGAAANSAPKMPRMRRGKLGIRAR